jgi:hypothetical protein
MIDSIRTRRFANASIVSHRSSESISKPQNSDVVHEKTRVGCTMTDELILTIDSSRTQFATASMVYHRSSKFRSQTTKLGCNARGDSSRLHDDG